MKAKLINEIESSKMMATAINIAMGIIEMYSFYSFAGGDPIKQIIFSGIGALIILMRGKLQWAMFVAAENNDYKLYAQCKRILLGSSIVFIISLTMLGAKHFNDIAEEDKRQSLPVQKAEQSLTNAQAHLDQLRQNLSASEAELSAAEARLSSLQSQRLQIEKALNASHAAEIEAHQARLDAFWNQEIKGIPYRDIMHENCAAKTDSRGQPYTRLAGQLCSQLQSLQAQAPKISNDPSLQAVSQQITEVMPLVSEHQRLQAAKSAVTQAQIDYTTAVETAPDSVGNALAGFGYLADGFNFSFGGLFGLSTEAKFLAIGFVIFIGILLFAAYQAITQVSLIKMNGGQSTEPPAPKKPDGEKSNGEKIFTALKTALSKKEEPLTNANANAAFEIPAVQRPDGLKPVTAAYGVLDATQPARPPIVDTPQEQRRPIGFTAREFEVKKPDQPQQDSRVDLSALILDGEETCFADIPRVLTFIHKGTPRQALWGVQIEENTPQRNPHGFPFGGWIPWESYRSGQFSRFKNSPVVIKADGFALVKKEGGIHRQQLAKTFAIQGIALQAGKEVRVYIASIDKPDGEFITPFPKLVEIPERRVTMPEMATDTPSTATIKLNDTPLSKPERRNDIPLPQTIDAERVETAQDDIPLYIINDTPHVKCAHTECNTVFPEEKLRRYGRKFCGQSCKSKHHHAAKN